MILIINICKEELHELEFVKPIADILRKRKINFEIKHYKEINEKNIKKFDKIIIAGTSLKDNQFLESVPKLQWIKLYNKPILGICAGMQIFGKIFGCEVYDKAIIGQEEIKITQKNDLIEEEDPFYSYFLNNKTIKLTKDFEVLARGNEIEAVIKHKSKRVYGCLFHPEVMNSEIIVNFCKFI